MLSRAARTGFLPALVVTAVLASAFFFPTNLGKTILVCQGYGYGCPKPTVTEIWPFAGPITGGTVVDIYGTEFNNFAPATLPQVKFGTTPALLVIFISDTHIRAVSPSHAAGLVHVTVTTAAGPNDPTNADVYRFVNANYCAIFNPHGWPSVWKQNVTQSFKLNAFNCGMKTWPGTGYNRVVSSVHFTTKIGSGYNTQQFWLGNNYHNIGKNVPSNRGVLIRITLTPRFRGTVYLESEMLKVHQFWFGRYLYRPPQFRYQLVTVTR